MTPPAPSHARLSRLRELLGRLTAASGAGAAEDAAEALAELDAVEAEVDRMHAAAAEASYLTNLVSSMSDLVVVASLDGAIRVANPAASAITGLAREELLEKPLARIFPDLSPPDFGDILERDGVRDEERLYVNRSGDVLPVSLSASVVRDAAGQPEALLCVARDLTESKRIEEERLQLLEAVQRQEILLDALSTPLLPIARGVLLAPLVGPVDAHRAARLTEALLEAVAARQIRVAIVDLTGVREIAAETVAGLLGAVQAVRLLGARAVLTGIRPEVARAHVEIGADLAEVPTFGALQAGIAHAMS